MTLRSRVVSLSAAPSAARYTALVPIGYADGYPRPHATPEAAVALVGGRRTPVRSVTMDLTLVEVDASCRVGNEVVLLGAQGDARVGADEVARWNGTIPWQILSAVSKRVPRHYRASEV
jgi:alanine racemase